ncbi:uncharacterized protein ATNIH1004_005359 [Aspergillus tanneri]|uniref:Uncharacterized protein n=1 Tax=Aspergillus tanneri TaxID=1220188 RepID=A0A5M9MMN7_9EURO|nr:uncharacterized protein ATNIH1004_005359 [Aspergillus tanneri]KAA8646684.1 hypothetical protein ATNIH1004_005359 [Aspergillus tanneri]
MSEQHEHPPPPPIKAPPELIADIRELIQSLQNPDLTLSSFLRSPELQALCQRYDVNHITDLHQSFVNMDRFALIIQKAKLILYPEGQGLMGLQWMRNRRPEIKDYVREVFQDGDTIIIICALDSQLHLLQSVSSFEIDMGWKRLRSNNLKEVVFAIMSRDHGKIITLLRVLSIVKMLKGQPLRFKYLHGSGIRSIIADMDRGQMEGLGYFLQTLSNGNEDWQWHVKHVMIFCRIHFLRGVEEVVGKCQQHTELFKRMMALLDCKSEEDYIELVQHLLHTADPESKHEGWALHKADPVIAAGLNKSRSRMDSEDFDEATAHTNAAEQTHEKGLAMGRALSIVKAVQTGYHLDKRDMAQYDTRDLYRIRHSYSKRSGSDLFAESLRRGQRKQSHLQGLLVQKIIRALKAEDHHVDEGADNSPETGNQEIQVLIVVLVLLHLFISEQCLIVPKYLVSNNKQIYFCYSNEPS